MDRIRPSRTRWLQRVAAALLATAVTALACAPDATPHDDGATPDAGVPVAQDVYPVPDGAWNVENQEFEAMMRQAEELRLQDLPVGERVAGFGKLFLGLPYVAHTLELPGPEQLVVNLKELDCVTHVENALALAIAAGQDASYASFLRALERIRYRGGRLDGYTSRLHYFTDWIADNERKGVVRDITRELGGIPATREIGFMSTNRHAYRQLQEEPALVDSIRRVEAALNAREWYWIPQDRIEAVESRIQEGDVIGITTSIAGLDVSHTGLATWVNGRLHLLHAPDVGQPVEISRRPLAERIQGIRLQTGIVVARPLAP
jgi:hypothetical protein